MNASCRGHAIARQGSHRAKGVGAPKEKKRKARPFIWKDDVMKRRRKGRQNPTASHQGTRKTRQVEFDGSQRARLKKQRCPTVDK